MSAEPLNVDEIAPPTSGLEATARHRVDEIVKAWAHRLSVWGSTTLYGPGGTKLDETFSLVDLAVASYVQGARDAIAVSVTSRFKPVERGVLEGAIAAFGTLTRLDHRMPKEDVETLNGHAATIRAMLSLGKCKE